MMAESRDVKKMEVFGNAEHWAFEQMLRLNPNYASQWLAMLEPVAWNNYITEREAEDIAAEMVGQDGSKGFRWRLQDVEGVAASLGEKVEVAPYYNKYALYATMNMLASDHYETMREYIDEAKMPEAIFRMAVDKLTDADRPSFIREYFDI